MSSSNTHTEPQHEKDNPQKGKAPRIPSKLRYIDPKFLHNTFPRTRSSTRKKDRTASHPTGQRNAAAWIAPLPMPGSRSQSFPESAIGQSRPHLLSKAEVDALVQDDLHESAVFVTPVPSPSPPPFPPGDTTLPASDAHDPLYIAIGDNDVPMTNALHQASSYAAQNPPINWPGIESPYGSSTGVFSPSDGSAPQQYLVQASDGYEEGWVESPTPVHHSSYAFATPDLYRLESYPFHGQHLAVQATFNGTTFEQFYVPNQADFNQLGSESRLSIEQGQNALPYFESSAGVYPEPSSRTSADDLSMFQQNNYVPYFAEPSDANSGVITSSNAAIDANPPLGYQNHYYPQSAGKDSLSN